VIICEPEIRCFKIESNFDFILIGCDGIFDRLNNREVVNTVWESTLDLVKTPGRRSNPYIQSQQIAKGYLNQLEQANSLNSGRKQALDSARAAAAKYSQSPGAHVTIHQAVAEGVEMVLKQSAAARSLDNITCVILGFQNYEQTVAKLNEGHTLASIKEVNILENKGKRLQDKFDDSQVIPEDFTFLLQQMQLSNKPMSSPPVNSGRAGEASPAIKKPPAAPPHS